MSDATTTPRKDDTRVPQRGRKLSVVVPGLNEERCIPALVERLRPVLEGLGLDWEVIFVDDGSTDGTLELIKSLHRQDPRFKGLSLSRNFGKEIAAAAGLRYATGDAAILWTPTCSIRPS